MDYFLKVTTASPEAQAIQENLAAIISSNHASDSMSVMQMMTRLLPDLCTRNVQHSRPKWQKS